MCAIANAKTHITIFLFMIVIEVTLCRCNKDNAKVAFL